MSIQNMKVPGVKVTVSKGARNLLQTGFKDLNLVPYCEGTVGYTEYAIATEIKDVSSFDVDKFEASLREVMWYSGFIRFDVIELWSDE